MTTSDKIEAAKELLRNSKRVFVLTGAGVSAESGVPTFRGGGGVPVWRGMPFEQLSSAQMVERDLPLVWEWFDYRRGLIGECEPNNAHRTLAKVQQSGRFEEFSLVTQNIDGLHQAAGSNDVIELHGSIWQARCLSCKNKQSLRVLPEDERPPVCLECSDSMRPDVILFGEAMPMQAVYEAQEKAQSCDLCFVIGTSSLVYPAAELPIIAKRNGAKVIEINPEETALSAQANVSLRGKAAEILPLVLAEDNSPNPRLPSEKIIKSAAEQTRKERQSEKESQSNFVFIVLQPIYGS
jgi:NAD-dependent deacetylase